MDTRALAMDDLARAEKIVAESERNVQRQRETVALLERRGLDTATAKALLEQYELALAKRIEGLNRMREKVAS